MPRFLSLIQSLPFIAFLLSSPPVRAQIAPDGTLRNNSVVNLVGTQWNITGGETIGSNLFHSFSTFNVGTGETAFFNNATTLQNIIARITGGTRSTIDGLIRVNGTANLFLINPSGITFGANAQLNLGGSFFASTADSVVFSDGNAFSATNPQAAPLLTVSVPVGLQMGSNPGNIAVNSQSLQVFPSRTLGFIGGNLQLEGAQLQASQGRIELGSVGANGFIRLTPSNTNITASYDGANFQDIQLSNTTVDTSGFGGGKIQVQGRNVGIANGSQVVSRTTGSQAGGDITLRGSESVSITGADPLRLTTVANDTLGTGAGGNVIVETGQFLLQGTAFAGARTLSSGVGGDVTIRASERAVLAGVGLSALEPFLLGSFFGLVNPLTPFPGLVSATAGDGNSGDITIETGFLSLQNGALASNQTVGRGSSGNINIRTPSSVEIVGSAIANSAVTGSQGSTGKIAIDTSQLTVRDGGFISIFAVGSGQGGDVEIAASDFVELSRTRPDAILPTGLINNSAGTGAGGDIEIATGRLTVREGAVIAANSGGDFAAIFPIGAGGPGGHIFIEAQESVEVSGSSSISFAGSLGGGLPSSISTTTFTSFPAGDVTIRTRRLALADGALISSGTLSSGNGGNLTVEASESVELIGRSSLTGVPTNLTTSSGQPNLPQFVTTGSGGDITLRTGTLNVRDGATVDLRSFGVGDAGTLDVAANSIFLDRGSSLNASTIAGAGGNIRLNSNLILLRRGSNITTDAGDTDGGNIFINAGNLVAVPTEDSDISANSRNSRGGNITINVSGGILGLRFQDRDTPFSDITATGRDSSSSGTVTINNLNVNLAAGLEALAEDVADPSNQIASGCAAYAQSRLSVVGRGGLPEDPTVTIPGQTVWRDLQTFSSALTSQGESISPQDFEKDVETSHPLIEATSWRVNEAGNVELVAVFPQENGLQKIPSCQN